MSIKFLLSLYRLQAPIDEEELSEQLEVERERTRELREQLATLEESGGQMAREVIRLSAELVKARDHIEALPSIRVRIAAAAPPELEALEHRLLRHLYTALGLALGVGGAILWVILSHFR